MLEIEIKEQYLLRNNLQIYVKEFIPSNIENSLIPAIIICHGFGANCSGNYDYCAFFAKHGYAAYCFDFCGGSRKGEGRSSGDTVDMNIWTECEDLITVLSYVKQHKFIDHRKITLMGSSQGGLVSGLTAAKCREEVKNLVMICPALCIPDDARRGHLGGASYDITNVPDEIKCPNNMVIGKQFHNIVLDMDPFFELAKYKGNILLVHGMQDKTVNYSYTVKLANHYKKEQCQLKLVRNAAHSFSEKLKNSIMITIFNFLEEKKEIFTIQVFTTKKEVMKQKEDYQESVVYITGYCDNEYFKGTMLPGAKEVQTQVGDEAATVLKAEYILYGIDYKGNVCEINIVNQWKEEFFGSRITTDSPVFSCLNNKELMATLESFENGFTIRIFGDILLE